MSSTTEITVLLFTAFIITKLFGHLKGRFPEGLFPQFRGDEYVKECMYEMQSDPLRFSQMLAGECQVDTTGVNADKTTRILIEKSHVKLEKYALFHKILLTLYLYVIFFWKRFSNSFLNYSHSFLFFTH